VKLCINVAQKLCMEINKIVRRTILPNTWSLKCSLCHFMSRDVHFFLYKALLFDYGRIKKKILELLEG
jgi:hypothetical protein